MNGENSSKTDETSLPGGLAEVDKLLASASSSISCGDYDGAINSFEEVVELTRSIFGDNIELAEVQRKIVEIQSLLEKLRDK